MKAMKDALKPVVRDALRAGGAALGGAAFGPTGSIFGREMGSRLSKLIGSGDYASNMSTNDLIRPAGLSPSSSFGPASDMVVITRREFLADVLAPSVAGTFTNYSYPINAGLVRSFPFLSQLASNYEEYCFDGLVYEFISSASPYITNSALGTVIAAMEYNSSSAPFQSKYEMENSAHAVSTRLDKNLMYGVECARGTNPLNCYYMRTGTSSVPLTSSDLGFFQLAVAPSTTVPTSSVLGELWVTYKVCLKRPVLSLNRFSLFHTMYSGATTAAPFGATVMKTSYAGSTGWERTSSTVLSLTNGVIGDIFQIQHVITGTVAIAGALTYGGYVLAGAATYAGYSNGTTTQILTGNAVGLTTFTVTSLIRVTAVNATVTHNAAGANYPTGVVTSEVLVSFMGHNTLEANF